MIRKCLLSGIHSGLLLFTCLGGIAVSLPAEAPMLLPSLSFNRVSVEPIKQIAKSITVKILSKGFLGTGTLINKQGKIYTVITNDHVLNAAEPPYQIQTPDGRIYEAKVSQLVKFGDDDLGLLQFNSDQVYEIASVGNSSALTVGDEVFASGFTSENKEMIFTNGNLSLLLDKPLEGGYQMGYINDIYKGMSGGPLLNIQGELVGINGVHKNPLWEVTELYADGSEPCKPIQDIIPRNSWGIPITTVEKIVPQLMKIPASNSVNKPLVTEEQNNSTILQMREKAEGLKKCILQKKDQQEMKK